jgi:hypothetical protein
VTAHQAHFAAWGSGAVTCSHLSLSTTDKTERFGAFLEIGQPASLVTGMVNEKKEHDQAWGFVGTVSVAVVATAPTDTGAGQPMYSFQEQKINFEFITVFVFTMWLVIAFEATGTRGPTVIAGQRTCAGHDQSVSKDAVSACEGSRGQGA